MKMKADRSIVSFQITLRIFFFYFHILKIAIVFVVQDCLCSVYFPSTYSVGDKTLKTPYEMITIALYKELSG